MRANIIFAVFVTLCVTFVSSDVVRAQHKDFDHHVKDFDHHVELSKPRVLNILAKHVNKQADGHIRIFSVAIDYVITDGVLYVGKKPVSHGEQIKMDIIALVRDRAPGNTEFSASRQIPVMVVTTLTVTKKVFFGEEVTEFNIHQEVIEVDGEAVSTFVIERALISINSHGVEKDIQITKLGWKDGHVAPVSDVAVEPVSKCTKFFHGVKVRFLKLWDNKPWGPVLIISTGSVFSLWLGYICFALLRACCKKKSTATPTSRSVYLKNVKVHYVPLSTGEKKPTKA